MCTSLLLWDVHPALLLLLLFNRDEFWDRPTQPAHFWPDHPSILAGRDVLRQGTWLGVTRTGRVALLTNYRERLPSHATTQATEDGGDVVSGASFVKTTNAPSRGALTANFLTGSASPLEYLQSLNQSEHYGFNLIVGDLTTGQLAYGSNRAGEPPRLLPPGVYGLSNGLLQQWPKVQRGISSLLDCLRMDSTVPNLEQLYSQQQQHQGQQEHQAEGAARGETVPPPSQQPPGMCSDACSAAAAAEAAMGDRAADDPHGECAAAAAPGGDGTCGSSDDGALPWAALFSCVMGDTRTVQVGEPLPLTGVGESLDRVLSSIFISSFEAKPGSLYGTRSQTALAVWRDGRMEQRERYVELDEAGADWRWQEARHTLSLQR